MAVVKRGKIHFNILQLGSFDVCKKKSRVANHFLKHFSNLSYRKDNLTGQFRTNGTKEKSPSSREWFAFFVGKKLKTNYSS